MKGQHIVIPVHPKSQMRQCLISSSFPEIDHKRQKKVVKQLLCESSLFRSHTGEISKGTSMVSRLREK